MPSQEENTYGYSTLFATVDAFTNSYEVHKGVALSEAQFKQNALY